MYTIKAFTADGEEYTLHNPKIRNLIVGDPYYQKGDNVNGQAGFSVYPKHPYYQYVKKLTTDIVIYKDEVEKFAGRVLYDDQDSKGVKKVFVEGELAYFCDSVQRPAVYHNISVRDYVSKIIDNHNAQVETRKQFALGRVTVTDPNDSLYRYANWETSRDTLKKKLVERLGGHLVVRKEDGIRYLDYLSDTDFYRQNTQEIRFGKNLLDYSENMDASDLVTCVIPLGATQEESSIEGLDERLTISSVNGGVDYVSDSDAVAAYGKIYKTVTWDDVTVPANLLRKGKEYLKSTQFENMVLNLKAIDLNLTDAEVQEFEVGDLIHCVSPPHGLDSNIPLSSITVYLTDFAKNTVTLSTEKTNSTYTSSNAEKASQLDETIKSIPGKREILQEALRNATDLMNDMTKSGYAIHEKNEFIVADAPGAKTATNLWRWGLGGLAHYSQGYDGPIDGVALTMDGKINGGMLMVQSVTAEKIDVEYTKSIEDSISDAESSANKYTDSQKDLLKQEVGTAIKNTENSIVLSASSLKEYVSRKNYIVNGEQETLTIGNFSLSGTGTNAKAEITEFLNMNCLKISFSGSATVQITQSVGTLEPSTYTVCCDAAYETGKCPSSFQVGFSDSVETIDLSTYSANVFQVFKHSVKTAEKKEKKVSITVRGTAGTSVYLTNIRCLEDITEIVDNVSSSLKEEIDNITLSVTEKFQDYSTTVEMCSMINETASSIKTEVSKKTEADEVKSLISQEADNIRLMADKISWSSTYSSMTEDGKLTCTNATILGNFETRQAWKDSYKITLIEEGIIKGYMGDTPMGVLDMSAWYPDSKAHVALQGYDLLHLQAGDGVNVEVTEGAFDVKSATSEIYGETHIYVLSDGDASVAGKDAILKGSNTALVKSDGTVTVRGNVVEIWGDTTKVYELPHVSSGGHIVFGSDGQTLSYLASSSKRYKNHVANITDEEAEKVLDITPVWFKYKPGYLTDGDPMNDVAVPGFYAENVGESLPVVAWKNSDGELENWDERKLIPFMLKAIQILYQRTGGKTQ